jgi:hypothetical protein
MYGCRVFGGLLASTRRQSNHVCICHTPQCVCAAPPCLRVCCGCVVPACSPLCILVGLSGGRAVNMRAELQSVGGRSWSLVPGGGACNTLSLPVRPSTLLPLPVRPSTLSCLPTCVCVA